MSFAERRYMEHLADRRGLTRRAPAVSLRGSTAPLDVRAEAARCRELRDELRATLAFGAPVDGGEAPDTDTEHLRVPPEDEMVGESVRAHVARAAQGGGLAIEGTAGRQAVLEAPQDREGDAGAGRVRKSRLERLAAGRAWLYSVVRREEESKARPKKLARLEDPEDEAAAEQLAGPQASDAARLAEGGDEEVLVTFAVHHPIKVGPTRAQEFTLLGSQPLTDLRDAIECPADDTLRHLDRSAPGAYIFLGGVFYDDTRDAAASDLSKPITDAFARLDARAESRPPVRKCAMQAATVGDICAPCGRAGAGVYCHQGCCEHLLEVVDVRLRHPDDPVVAAAYPLRCKRPAWRVRLCEGRCGASAAAIVHGDVLLGHTPGYLCAGCFRDLHGVELKVALATCSLSSRAQKPGRVRAAGKALPDGLIVLPYRWD
ncbi:unnamed protein product [Pedinophyceae sp. YPF-701]|nr:unnamed protein product [Pedinophyceae sp. YPF-701]